MTIQKKVEYWPNSQAIKQIVMVDEQGKKQGVATSFYPNGAVWGKVMYQDNQLEGAFVRYYPDGAILEKGTYLHGWLHGMYESYNRNGEVINRKMYSHGWLDNIMINSMEYNK